jgi:hypothetical protein
MNCFQRLSPPTQHEVVEFQKNFPLTGSEYITDLESTSNYFNLKFSTIIFLARFENIFELYHVNKIFNEV